MYAHVIHESCSVERGINAFGKTIDSCQPAQSVQTDMGRNLSLSLDFLNVNPFPNKPWFLRVSTVNHLKTLWERKNILCLVL